jgi:hypothetical protein
LTKFLITIFSLLLFGGVAAQEIDPSAERALIVVSEMGQQLAGLESFSVRSESTFDEPLSGQLVEQSQTTDIMAHRTEGFRMNTEGDLMNSSAYFNGTDFVMFDQDRNFYAVTPFSGTLHALTDHLANKLGVILPVAELLRNDPGKAMIDQVETIFYVGLNKVEDDHCHHVAGRNKNGMEWELWVSNDTLLPRKVVVRDPSLPGAPRSVAVLSNWKLNPTLPEMIFHFLIPPEATQIEFKVPSGGKS